MSEGQDQVDENEGVLRRIHKIFYNADSNIPVQPEAFRPTERDNDGLSVFRDRFVSPVQVLVDVAESKRGLYYIARLTVRDLQALHLTVIPAPRSGLPGHALIPELNWGSYQKDKLRLKELQVKLAWLASQAIVHRPDIS
jgi:hypothetical protein